MASKGFLERILEIHTAGSALTGSTTETSLLAADSFATIPAFYFDVVKKGIFFCFGGKFTNRVTGPDTFKFRLFLGSIAVFDSGLIPLNIVAKTNVPWTLEGELIATAVGNGTTTTLFPKNCKFTSEVVIGSPAATAGGNGVLLLPFNTAPAAGSGFDNSSSQLIDLKGTQSTATTNSCQLLTGNIDVLT